MTVAVVGGIIAVVGALAAAMISASGSGPGSRTASGETQLVLSGVASVERGRELVVTARGRARGLAEGGVVYVVLEPTFPESATATSGKRVFRSEATIPNRAGVWEATLSAPSRVGAGFIVSAVEGYGMTQIGNETPALAPKSSPLPGFANG